MIGRAVGIEEGRQITQHHLGGGMQGLHHLEQGVERIAWMDRPLKNDRQ